MVQSKITPMDKHPLPGKETLKHLEKPWCSRIFTLDTSLFGQPTFKLCLCFHVEPPHATIFDQFCKHELKES